MQWGLTQTIALCSGRELQKLTNIDILRIGRATLPFIVLMLAILLLVTVFPALVTFFPRNV